MNNKQAKKMIAIIDYGIGNVGSITNMLKRVKTKSYLASTCEDVEKAEKIILPGIGHFGSGMEALRQSGLIPALEEKALNQKIPILGICLGMHLMGKFSEEGNEKGLGWFDGNVKHFSNMKEAEKVRIPHMGWNYVNIVKKNDLTEGFFENSKFYFVHSYFFECENPNDILLSTNYGEEFTSAFQKENLMGVQFHPEKSHKYGMRLMENFARLGC